MDAPKNYDIKTFDEILREARSMIGRQKKLQFRPIITCRYGMLISQWQHPQLSLNTLYSCY